MSAFDFPQWVKAEQAKAPAQHTPAIQPGETVVPVNVAAAQQQPKRPGRPKGSKSAPK